MFIFWLEILRLVKAVSVRDLKQGNNVVGRVEDFTLVIIPKGRPNQPEWQCVKY